MRSQSPRAPGRTAPGRSGRIPRAPRRSARSPRTPRAVGLAPLLAVLILASASAVPGWAAPSHPGAGVHAHDPGATPGAVAPSDTARVRRWREDLRTTADRVLQIHPRPFAFAPRAAFDSAVASIDARVPELDDARLSIELMRMVALLGDGHTMLIGTLPNTGFTRVLPLLMRPFEDGLRVTGAAPEHAGLVGARVIRIGTLPADEALERVLGIVSGDNRYTRLDRVPLFLMVPLALHALGIAPEPDRVTLEVETLDGPRRTATIVGGTPPEGFPMAFNESEPRLPAGWRSARVAAGLPRCDRRPDEAWWSEYLPERRLLYLRMRRIDPVSGEQTFARFLRRFLATADSLRPAALAIDLRHDHGGNNLILDPLVHGLAARPWLDRDGGLFVLTDRGTFSAAMNACVFLETQTHALFVGEPTGGRVNHYGDTQDSQLPNSGLMLMVSEWPWAARVPWDDRPWIAPHLATPATFADWRDGRDRALEAVEEALANGTFEGRVRAAARTGTPGVLTAVDAWSHAHPDRWGRTTVSELEQLGGRLIDEGAPEAVAVWDARLERYPESSFAWRRMAEACFDAGDRARTISSLKRAVELNPESRIARAMLERLGAGP